MAATANRQTNKLLTVSAGTSTGAFRPADWGLLAVVALTWGASFLFIDIGLDSFSPYLVGFVKDATGSTDVALYLLAAVIVGGSLLALRMTRGMTHA